MKYFSFILFVLVACSKPQMDDCITSLGKYKTTYRNVAEFTKVNVEDRIQVELVQDASKVGLIELRGPGNLLGQIETEVSEGELSLKNRNTCNFVRSFNYSLIATVYIDTIFQVKLASIATITNKDTLRLSKLEIFHYALSDISLTVDCADEIYVQSLNSATTVLSGKAKTLKGSIEEITELDARNLVCEEVLLDVHTPLDCIVNARKGLFIKIYNSGNVYYMQEPSLYKELNVRRGMGDLLPYN